MPDSALKIADKWDSALEQGIKRTAYGTIAGGVLAALLFRTFFLVSLYALHAVLLCERVARRRE